jgi:nitronate monooxygenase
MRTWLSERFGLDVPVVCAPMAGGAAGELAAAVCRAGGLGMIGAGGAATPEWISEQCTIAGSAGRPFGVGLLAWVLAGNPGQLDAVLAARPALVSVSYGPYPRYLPALREAGVTVATQAGTLAEAQAAEQAGVDVIVARGGEGGGHGRNDVATLPLLQMVLDTVAVPVLAAGGITGPRGLAAVLAAGAAGAWVGTAFLACTEATTSAGARERLFAATDTSTGYGRVFDIAQRLPWPPEYGGRALRNRFFDHWAGHEQDLETDAAAQAELASARERGDYGTACIYAGQGAAMLTRQRPAAEVVADLATAHSLLQQAARQTPPERGDGLHPRQGGPQ